jgi:DNA-binding SARP family transcriptional activator
MNQAVVMANLQQALNEQRIRAETIGQLLSALDEQQAQLGADLSAALQALGAAGFVDHVRDVSIRLPDSELPSLPATSPTLVRCLGALEVHVRGAAIDSWRSGKARAVFEYLVTHRGRPIPRDRLIQALWPDPDALASGTSLKVAVHALRQIFSGTRGEGQPPSVTVVAQESSYQIVAPGLWLDVEEFERCCALGTRLEANAQAHEALVMYERAAELYRGDFLPDSWDEWAIFRREGLKDQYLFILARLADARLRSGDFHACIRLCRLLLEQDCCREDTFRMLMLCHAQLGQRGRVKRWYELCVQTLRSELDSEPEAETVRVYQQACSGNPPALASAGVARLTAL